MRELDKKACEECETRDEWLRKFIQLNPDAFAFAVLQGYQASGLSDRLGAITIDEIQDLQAQLGAGGLTPSRLEAVRKRTKEKGEAYEERQRQRAAARTAAELGKLPDTDVMYAIIERLRLRRSGTSFAESGSFPLAATHVEAVYYLDADVHNGGFRQYFENTEPERVELAMDSLSVMGLGEYRTIVEQAFKSYREHGGDAGLEALYKGYAGVGVGEAAAGAPSVLRRELVRYIREHLDELVRFSAGS